MSKNYLRVINDTDKNRFNCVLWARQKCASLPFGLWTIWDKRKIINSRKARVGAVAIINVGLPIGHVAIVSAIGSNHITIQEANYKTGKITERHGSESELKILGYFVC